LSSNLLNEVGSLFWYFEVRVRYCRKKFAFAISSPDEFLFCVQMASGLSEQQRLKIEENRQRALALRAARQLQQPQLSASADVGRRSNAANNNCQSATHSTSARSSSVNQSSSGPRGTHCTNYPRKTAKYSSAVSSSASFGSKAGRLTTLTDSSNRTASELNAAVPVKCCLISKQTFAADARYFAPLVDVFKSIPSKQYGNKLTWTTFIFDSLLCFTWTLLFVRYILVIFTFYLCCVFAYVCSEWLLMDDVQIFLFVRFMKCEL